MSIWAKQVFTFVFYSSSFSFSSSPLPPLPSSTSLSAQMEQSSATVLTLFVSLFFCLHKWNDRLLYKYFFFFSFVYTNGTVICYNNDRLHRPTHLIQYISQDKKKKNPNKQTPLHRTHDVVRKVALTQTITDRVTRWPRACPRTLVTTASTWVWRAERGPARETRRDKILYTIPCPHLSQPGYPLHAWHDSKLISTQRKEPRF